MMIRHTWSYCVICNTYKRNEINNRTFKKLEKIYLNYGESKIFIICKECMNKMKEGVDKDE